MTSPPQPSTTWTLPAVLSPPLSPAAAATDALYRLAAGLDTNDRALFTSALHPDVTSTLDNGAPAPPLVGLDAICAGVFARVAQLDTMHFCTNVRVHVAPDAASATVSSHVLAQHYRRGEGAPTAGGTAPRYLGGAYYMLRVVPGDGEGDRAAGLWRIKEWRVKIAWAEGDATVLAV